MIRTFQILTNTNCNLRCKYCYEHNKDIKVNDPNIVIEYIATILADENVRKYIQNVSIEFIGGESLLYPVEMMYYIEIILQLCKYYKLKYLPQILLTTNGTLFENKQVKELIEKYGRYIELTISLDGTKECHDLNRVDIHGNGTYDKIIYGLDFYKQHICKRKLLVKSTFNHDTIKYYKDSILNLIKLGFTNIIANTVYEEYWTDDDCIFIQKQLKDVADYILTNDLENKIIIQQINSDRIKHLDNLTNYHRNENYCGSCVYMNCLGMDSKLYGCHRFACNYSHSLGIIDKCGNIIISDGDFINKVNCHYHHYPKECDTCPSFVFCGSCAALPYELNLSAGELFAQKRQCGFTKAIHNAHIYFAEKLKEKYKL